MQRRVLVIQIERLGDLVQTTPLLARLIADPRYATVDALVLESTAQILEGMPGLGRVHTLKTARILELERALSDAGQGMAPPACWTTLQELDLGEYDLVVNACHKQTAAWITAQVPAQERRGALINDHGGFGYRSDSLIYLHSMVDAQRWNRFNLVDLLIALALDSPRCTAGLYVARAPDAGVPIPEGRLVALNPGASRADRRWPVEGFAHLCTGLKSAGFTPVIVGGPDDRRLAGQVRERAGSGVIDLCGSNSVTEMRTFFESVACLVTNDTGAAHIAAAAGIPIVSLHAPGGARLTGPYGQNHVAFEPLSLKEKPAIKSIPMATVLSATLAQAKGAGARGFGRRPEARGARAWRSTWIDDATDVVGGLYLESLVHSDCDDEAKAMEARRAFGREFARRSAAEEGSCLEGALGHVAREARQLALVSDTDGLNRLQRTVDDLALPVTSDAQPEALVQSFLHWGLKLTEPHAELRQVLHEVARLCELAARLTAELGTTPSVKAGSAHEA